MCPQIGSLRRLDAWPLQHPPLTLSQLSPLLHFLGFSPGPFTCGSLLSATELLPLTNDCPLSPFFCLFFCFPRWPADSPENSAGTGVAQKLVAGVRRKFRRWCVLCGRVANRFFQPFKTFAGVIDLEHVVAQMPPVYNLHVRCGLLKGHVAEKRRKKRRKNENPPILCPIYQRPRKNSLSVRFWWRERGNVNWRKKCPPYTHSVRQFWREIFFRSRPAVGCVCFFVFLPPTCWYFHIGTFCTLFHIFSTFFIRFFFT